MCVNYGGIQALQNIDLLINQGEVITLIGANGAGKSTTLKAISRLINYRSGYIYYNGRDISRYPAYKMVHTTPAISISNSNKGMGNKSASTLKTPVDKIAAI